jgi:phosphoribosylformylglycinamidine synthase subunit PurL
VDRAEDGLQRAVVLPRSARGAKLAVAEAARNLVCAGAKPLGVTNCLNFGNPNKPEVFWQFAEAIAGDGRGVPGAGDAGDGRQREPVQRESPAGAVYPTPVIGMIGLIEAPRRPMSSLFRGEGREVWLLGPDPTHWAEASSRSGGRRSPVGPCPRLDLDDGDPGAGLILELNGKG